MALLELNAAKRIKDELLGLVVQDVMAAAGSAGAARFQTLEAPARQTSPVAVGISRKPDQSGYAVAVRVQGDSEVARREGDRLSRLARASGATVDYAEVKEARIPASFQAGQSPGHPLLTQRAQKLCVGLSIGHANGGLGTLGFFVEKAGKAALASCSHVIAESGLIERDGLLIHHPGRPDVAMLGGRTKIARLEDDYVEFTTEKGGTNMLDAALAPLLRPDDMIGNCIPAGLGCVADGKRLRLGPDLAELEARIPLRVGKVGRTTGYSEGTLNAVLDQVRVVNPKFTAPLLFINVLEVEFDDEARPFTQAGDSGSAVFTLDELQVVGMHFASPGGRSYACPVHAVLGHYGAGWL